VYPMSERQMSDAAGLPERWVGIVDDDPSVRRSLARVLRLQGIRVETFASGEEFLEHLSRGVPDCLVLDVHLGGLSGFEVQDVLRERGNPPPIIFITAHDDIPTSRLCDAAGPCGYLRKPFDVNVLITRIHYLLSRTIDDEAEADASRLSAS
jgi:two-component system, LuxR family, response regulator FixJ